MLRAALFSLSLITAFAAPAYAEGMTAQQVVEVAVASIDEAGNEIVTYETAGEVAPGDEVRYRLEFVNEGSQVAENVELVMPVPAELTLIDGSVVESTALVTYSSDNGTTFKVRDELTVGDGEELRPAGAEDVTHIKWAFVEGIAVSEAGAVSFRGILQ
ncbi:MAG: hypothetical protein AAGB16_01560 [Pseudomonadota bacterium]